MTVITDFHYIAVASLCMAGMLKRRVVGMSSQSDGYQA